MWKWTLRQVTGQCELLRLAYKMTLGAPRTSLTGRLEVHGRSLALPLGSQTQVVMHNLLYVLQKIVNSRVFPLLCVSIYRYVGSIYHL